MTVRFLDIAKVELDQALRWYESQAPGLGDALPIEVLADAVPRKAARLCPASP